MSARVGWRQARVALAALGLGVGAWQLGSGAWIHAKALVAQHLLRDAWSRAVAGAERPKPWPWADTYPVARLRVPAHGIDRIVLGGASGESLAFGPAHLRVSAVPGSEGHVVIAGHRDTHFAFLQHLENGDELILEPVDGPVRRYRVSKRQVIDSRTTRLRLGQSRTVLSLVTCYPFDAVSPGGPQRFHVIGELVELGTEG